MSTDDWSRNESGWTAYIASSPEHEDDEDEDPAETKNRGGGRKEDVESDDSMTSDASSGASNHAGGYKNERKQKEKQQEQVKKKHDDHDKKKAAKDKPDATTARSKKRKTSRLARATGEGVFNAIIWDVVVDPNFQGIGLGKAVMERLVNEQLDKGISNIVLYSEPRVLGFYRPLGFVADPDGIRGMVYSRKQKKRT